VIEAKSDFRSQIIFVTLLQGLDDIHHAPANQYAASTTLLQIPSVSLGESRGGGGDSGGAADVDSLFKSARSGSEICRRVGKPETVLCQ